MPRESFKPSWIYSLFFRPTVRGISIDENICITESRSVEYLDFSNIASLKTKKGVFYSSIYLQLDNGKSYELKGLSDDKINNTFRLLRRGQVNHLIKQMWPQLLKSHSAWQDLIRMKRYVANSQYLEWENQFDGQFQLPSQEEIALLEPIDHHKRKVFIDLRDALDRGRAIINTCNETFIKKELVVWQDFLNNIEENPLTESQRLAVIINEDSNLVVAGAGTGKTSTIIAKVGYILQKGLAKPEEILLLAFTRKAAEEIRQRIEEKFNTSLNVRTFHALGLEILGETEGERPSLCKEAEDEAEMQETVKNILDKLLNDFQFRKDYISFQLLFRVPYKPATEFKTMSEYKDYMFSNNLLRALNGVLVKSYEEWRIANWLYINGINFDYEAKYPVDVSNKYHRQYKPDFFLSDYNMYIEHFALDRNGNTPPFINRTQYKDNMAWKLNLHQIHGTKLIKTYSWQMKEGILFKELEKELKKENVTLKPLLEDELLDRINEIIKVDLFIRLLTTFQRLYKGNGRTKSDL